MASPNVTPFIPPLGTPSPGPAGPPQPPLVPTAPTGANPAYPQWAANPQTPGSYPAFGAGFGAGAGHPIIYPNTPYSAAQATPFLPATPLNGTGVPTYFPATGPPGVARPLPPVDAYPPFVPPGMGMHSPWGHPPVPMTPWGAPGTPWAAGPAGYPSPYPPAGAAPMGPPPAAFTRPMAYGGPGAGAPFTPGAPMPGGAAPDPWAAGPGGPAMAPWAQAQAAQQAAAQAQMGMGMPGMPGGVGLGFAPSIYGMGAAAMGMGMGAFGMQPEPVQRAMGQGGDRVGEFFEGPHYGPVLEPFLIRAVHAHVRLNPLLAPADVTSTTAPYLKWNMLFASNQCTRSDDPPHISWSKGRGEPATFPRVTFLRLVSHTVPWSINVPQRNRDVGVTCGDVIDAISTSMYGLASEEEFRLLPPTQKTHVSEAYRHNRSRANGVPGGGLSPGMLRLDWLGQDTMFGGVRENEQLGKQRCGGDVLPCTFELVCVKRYVLSAEEIRAQEALQRNVERERERRRRARRAAVESVTDEDDPGAGRANEDSSSSEEDEPRGRSSRSSRRG
ncbi:alpha-1,2-Mannosidase [Mycena chlorophos]|uniref:Alpha-1,2-Mannosidase n=1 Tax=Mycena chlorophos TaxID=658473 RepID=A0A8H6TQG2_MYCCL|nr:alpha-1,2-Mannosidase [Mycena chlorophos]